MKPTTLKTLGVLAGVSLLSGGITSAANYTQNFTFANGTAALGDGSTFTNGGGTPASVQGNALELTNVAFGGTQNSFNIPALANSSLGFTASFNITLVDTLGGNPPADGFSFNYGNFASSANYGEEGVGGTSISWIVDTWDNGIGGDQGIRSKVNGVNDFTQFFAPLADGATLSTLVSLSWNPATGMSLSLGGSPIFTNRATAGLGFTANDSYSFGFGARTGGATETVSIDNLVITTAPEPTGAMLVGVAGLGLMMRRRRK